MAVGEIARIVPVVPRSVRGNRPQLSSESEDIMELTGITRSLGVAPGWQFVLAGLGTMLTLAALDFVGAVFAKEWADTRHPGWFALGLASFAVLFVFYASSLKTAELSIVTIGWVVFLQVGLVLYERFRFGASLSPAKWAAIVLILALQAYLVLMPNDNSHGDESAGPIAVGQHDGDDAVAER
jgi:multidrug transporter EmrE-like cation transporter